MCGSKVGIQHHHYTEPPNEDYFIDVCNNCHPICERYDRLTNNKRKSLILDDVEIIIDQWTCTYALLKNSHAINKLKQEIAKLAHSQQDNSILSKAKVSNPDFRLNFPPADTHLHKGKEKKT